MVVCDLFGSPAFTAQKTRGIWMVPRGAKKGDHLFLLDRAWKHIVREGYAIVVEGYADALAMHFFGFRHTVAMMGLHLTQKQLYLLLRFTREIVVLVDPGGAFAFPRSRIPYTGSWCVLPADPDELLLREGVDAMRRRIEQCRANAKNYA